MLILSRTLIARQLGVKPRTIDAWARRGHITRHPAGYNITEVLAWWDSPDRQRMAELVSRRVACGANHTRVTSTRR